ncbi:MAG: SPFH domain-containing protein, partial [Bacteroidota bacterium]
MEIVIVLVVFGIMLITSALKITREYERAVIFRLGRFVGSKGPGLIILVPFIDKMVKVSLRTIAMDIDPQDIITKDNVSIKVNAVLYFRVTDPAKS